MKLKRVDIKDYMPYYRSYFFQLEGGFDDFFEGALLDAKHYLIEEDQVFYGICAISERHALHAIFLEAKYKHFYQKVFDFLWETNKVRGIFALSSDVSLMTNVLRKQLVVSPLAYQFHDLYVSPYKENAPIHLASSKDALAMKEIVKDFLEDIGSLIKNQSIYVRYVDQELVALGMMTKHKLHEDSVSLGIFVKETKRNQGFGKEMMRFLKGVANDSHLLVHAGCFHQNLASKHVLEASGLHVCSMIVKTP